jgi:phospho-N-acetylmuramoyl-pentapeptide-transferase
MISLMTSGGVALWISVLTAPVLIRWLIKHHIGQQIREDGPAVHFAKAGTPTMGGIGIVASVVIGYSMAHVLPGVRFSRSGMLVMLAIVGAGAIGFTDDWIKVRHRRSLGLSKRSKFGSQILLGLAFSLLAVYWAHTATTLSFTRYDSFGLHMGTALWVVWATVLITASANAVNLTDGLDGLAAGSATLCFACLAIIGYWQSGTSPSTTWGSTSVMRWTCPWHRWPWPAPVWAFCGGTPPRPRSSWAIPARCRSAPGWPPCA